MPCYNESSNTCKVQSGVQMHSGSLPVSPGATLAWLGFSEDSLLASYDSEASFATAHEIATS